MNIKNLNKPYYNIAQNKFTGFVYLFLIIHYRLFSIINLEKYGGKKI